MLALYGCITTHLKDVLQDPDFDSSLCLSINGMNIENLHQLSFCSTEKLLKDINKAERVPRLVKYLGMTPMELLPNVTENNLLKGALVELLSEKVM